MLITDEHDIRQAILQSGFQTHAQNCLDRVLARVAELEAFILRNSDPFSMTKPDAETFHGINRRTNPLNY